MALTVGAAMPAVARQEEASVGTVASIFSAVTAGRFVPELFEGSAFDADVSVRRQVALALGRIGDPRAVPILLRLMVDPDSATQLNAVFSLGLLKDSTAVNRLASLMVDTPAEEQADVHREAVVALARIGGEDAVRAFTTVLGRFTGVGPSERPPAVLVSALGEAWRLHEDAPISLLTQYVELASGAARVNAVRSLGVLRSTLAASVLIRSTEDPNPDVRAHAVEALDLGYVERSGLDPDGTSARVRRLTLDQTPAVRVAALKALSSYGGAGNVRAALDRAGDVDPDVRVQALYTLGEIGGLEAASLLSQYLVGGLEATRHAALEALAKADPPRALPVLGQWAREENWRTRALAARVAGRTAGDGPRDLAVELLRDTDRRVRLGALSGLVEAGGPSGDSIRDVFVLSPDPLLRSAAAGAFGPGGSPEDLTLLARAYEMGENDGEITARASALLALQRIWHGVCDGGSLVTEGFLDRVHPPEDPALRRIALRDSLFRQWVLSAPARLAQPGDEGFGDFREIARHLIFPTTRADVLPRVFFETDRGQFTVELDPIGAPLAVHTFLGLVETRAFEGLIWNSVNPGQSALLLAPELYDLAAVVEEPKPGVLPAGAIGVIGFPNDGASVGIFITKRPMPQLQGTGTWLGNVVDGLEVIKRLSVGDRVRRVILDQTGMTRIR